MSNRRRLAPFLVPLLFGLVSLFNIVGNPRFATFRAVDVVQLIATGMCFGAALASLVMILRDPRSS